MDPFDIVGTAEHPAFVADEEDRILAMSPVAESFLGYQQDEVLGRLFHQVIDGRDVFGNRFCDDGRPLHEMVRRGDPIQAFDIDVRGASGHRARVGVSVVVILGPGPSRYRLVYHVVPRQRRRRTDEAIDLLLRSHTSSQLSRMVQETPGNGSRLPPLTPREGQILRRFAAGETSREISATLEISLNTLRTHTRNILRKLGARSKVEAVSMALRHSLV